jgi:hypothetical protein
MSDGFTYDASLIVKNETLKKEVNKLTRALGNAYGGDLRTACYSAWVAKGFLSTKRDWAIPPRKTMWPLLLTRLVL